MSEELSSRPRFKATVAVAEQAPGFLITLDTRPVRTPAGAQLVLPNSDMASAVASEWRMLTDKIDYERLPLTRLANTALDAVAQKREEVIDDIVRYASSDLVCYRSASPKPLAMRQAELWDPILKWVHNEYDALFEVTEAVTFVQQRPLSLGNLQARLHSYSNFELTALHSMTSLLGSALIAMAHGRKHLSLAEAWEAAHVDEDWQEHQWGQDYEASQRRERRYRDFSNASRFFELAGAR
jgi:chaperone required for assembly of F1-ATPase